jgi:hypothetical protein
MTKRDHSEDPDAGQRRDASGRGPHPPRLVEPAAPPPARDERILAWVRERAARELSPRG